MSLRTVSTRILRVDGIMTAGCAAGPGPPPVLHNPHYKHSWRRRSFLLPYIPARTMIAAPKAGDGPLLERRADRALPGGYIHSLPPHPPLFFFFSPKLPSTDKSRKKKRKRKKGPNPTRPWMTAQTWTGRGGAFLCRCHFSYWHWGGARHASSTTRSSRAAWWPRRYTHCGRTLLRGRCSVTRSASRPRRSPGSVASSTSSTDA